MSNTNPDCNCGQSADNHQPSTNPCCDDAVINTLYSLSEIMAAHKDLQEILDTAARSTCHAMNVKAVSIRLLDKTGKELLVRSVCNLSDEYLNKGPVLLENAGISREALQGDVVYVEDMATDPRVIFPEDAKREGLVSILCAAMVYQERPIGVIRLYTGEKRVFRSFEYALLRAISQLLAAAIENARLAEMRLKAARIERQLEVAADVQRRMLPGAIPQLPPFDIAARYVPSLELSGDFYDLINLDGHLGIAVGDVVGKGMAASLLMASVRASLRAYAQDVYDLDEIISRVNIALCRDTRDNEFATLFYGVLDPQTNRLTYCNAGHNPPLLMRDGEFTELEAGGMILGVDRNQMYVKGLIDLEPGDMLLFYTDGLLDAINFDNESFGKKRILQAIRDRGDDTAENALNHVLWEMRRFTGLKKSFDDTTLVVVKVGK